MAMYRSFMSCIDFVLRKVCGKSILHAQPGQSAAGGARRNQDRASTLSALAMRQMPIVD